MSMSEYVREALLKARRQQNELAEAWGYASRQAMNNKFSRGSWSAEELARIAQFTGGELKIVYPDGQEIRILPDESKETKKGGKE